jgi:hypothetical protein
MSTQTYSLKIADPSIMQIRRLYTLQNRSHVCLVDGDCLIAAVKCLCIWPAWNDSKILNRQSNNNKIVLKLFFIPICVILTLNINAKKNIFQQACYDHTLNSQFSFFSCFCSTSYCLELSHSVTWTKMAKRLHVAVK